MSNPALDALKATVGELVQLTPLTVAKIADLRAHAAASNSLADDTADLQALADTIKTQIIGPLAEATADPAPHA